MNNDENRSWKGPILAGAGGLVVVALITWLMLPDSNLSDNQRAGVDVEALDSLNDRPGRKVVQMAANVPDDEPQAYSLDDDPNIKVVTPNCRLLFSQEQRGVPQFTVLDTLRDQSMVFNEDDLGCMTAAGVSPAVLDLAEQRIDYNALRGIKGTPGRNVTREHRTFREHPDNPDNQ